jgi:hypothetical protein
MTQKRTPAIPRYDIAARPAMSSQVAKPYRVARWTLTLGTHGGGGSGYVVGQQGDRFATVRVGADKVHCALFDTCRLREPEIHARLRET